MPSGIKRLLAEGKLVRVFSTGQLIGPKLVEMVALRGGFDAFWLDHEHAGVTLEAVEQTVRAVRAAGLDSFVRMAATDYATVMRFLEVGAGGIMAAHVRVGRGGRAGRPLRQVPPRGRRGLERQQPRRRLRTDPPRRIRPKCNRETFVAIQIENAEALENVEAIARVPDVDLLFVGPADLSSVPRHRRPVRPSPASGPRWTGSSGRRCRRAYPGAPYRRTGLHAGCSAAAAGCWNSAATSARSGSGSRPPMCSSRSISPPNPRPRRPTAGPGSARWVGPGQEAR